jgi:ABC-2 type transport system permease protein
MKALLRFELSAYFQKISFYFLLLLLAATGFFIAIRAGFVLIPNVYKNAPHSNTYFIGLASLICIFISTILAAKILFREHDANFGLILYATPLRKTNYLLSRFIAVFALTIIYFTSLVIGFAIAQQMPWLDRADYGSFNWWHYQQPLLLLALPNAFFCSAMVCSIGWLTGNKLIVYVSGLFIYILYIVTLLFSGSPLMAGGFPPTEEAMNLSAKLDPFGMSAFLQQTNNWSAPQRNTQLVSLSGNLLLNRLLFLSLSLAALLVAISRFRFSVKDKSRKRKELEEEMVPQQDIYKPVYRRKGNAIYDFSALTSLVKLDIAYVLKGIAFLLIAIGLVFFISVEFYSTIDRGIRLPEQYASTALLCGRIVNGFPNLGAIILLFYANELIWRSRNSNFNAIESATPVNSSILFIAKWFSLNMVVLILVTLMIATAILFQLLYQYPRIGWMQYISLYYLCGLPLMLTAGVVVCIQSVVKQKYGGLILSAIYVLLTTTSLGKSVGLSHPLVRFNNPYKTYLSEMSGWDQYIHAFGWKMLFGLSFTVLLILLASKQIRYNRKSWKPVVALSTTGLFLTVVLSGIFIFNKVLPVDAGAQLQWQQEAEETYRRYDTLSQPVVTDIKAVVDLFPEQNSYRVAGDYILRNKTGEPIDSLLIYVPIQLRLQELKVTEALSLTKDKNLGYYWFRFAKPLLPGKTANMQFAFSYLWDGFNSHESFNAIVKNGAFMRISNYFPRLGYQSGNEIEDKKERAKRNLGSQKPLLGINDNRTTSLDFITLDMTVSTSPEQTAIGVGDLISNHRQNGRNVFHYKTSSPIPFRFGISSANYAVQKANHHGIAVEAYYHPAHHENAGYLIENAIKTLDYCEANFGRYPYKTIRFAEISGFTRGFAATAYPATIFMQEDMLFHANIKGDKQQDVINELAGHELSHQWWGNAQLAPDFNREGAPFLTETLAMYSELMLVKKMYGHQRVLDLVNMHKAIYLSERGFADEQPLYKTVSQNAHQHYSKGLVAMYQLSGLIGEKSVNTALSRFLTKYAYPGPVPISTNLLDEFYLVSDTAVHERISELFEQIVLHDIKLTQSSIAKKGNQYEATVDISAKKFTEDGKGNQIAKPFNDFLEVAFYFANDKKQLLKVAVKDSLKITMPFSEKPVRVVLDPDTYFIDRNTEDNRKKM